MEENFNTETFSVDMSTFSVILLHFRFSFQIVIKLFQFKETNLLTFMYIKFIKYRINKFVSVQFIFIFHITASDLIN